MTLTGSLRYARHELMIWLQTWHGTVFALFALPVLYLGGIGLGVGALVQDEQAIAALGGVSYAAFAGTGLLAATSMQGAAADLMWPVYGYLVHTRTWEAAIATPIRPGDIVGGVVLVVSARLALAAVIFGIATTALGLTTAAGAARMVPPALLIVVACGTPMFALAGRVSDPVHLSNAMRFVILPIFLLSGTFFPISELPPAVQPLAALSPLWHGTELIRLAGLGTPTALAPLVHVAVLVVLGTVGTLLAVRTVTDRLQP